MHFVLAQVDDSLGDRVWNSLKDVVITFTDFIPNLVTALVLLVVGLFISRWVVRLLHGLLTKLKFDGLVDKSGLGQFAESAGYSDSALLLAKIAGFVVTLVFVQIAVEALGVESITNLLNTFIEWIPNVLIAILLILITGFVANFVRSTLTETLNAAPMGDLALKVIIAAIWVFGGMMAIDQLGFGRNIIDQLWTALTTGLAALIVIKFGVGGIWAARDRFWPKVYDVFESGASETSTPSA